MTDKLNNCFIEGKMSQVIWRYTLPMFGAILALLAYDLLESSLLAQNSAEILTSLGFTLPITTAMMALAIGTSIRCNNKVVKYACVANAKLNETIVNSLVISALIIVSSSMIALFLADDLLRLLGNNQWQGHTASTQTTATLTQQSNYMTVRYLGWIFLALIWQVNAILRAIGKTNLASGIMLSWLSFKSILVVVLSLPESDYYQVGLVGLSYTHGISDLLFACISLFILQRVTKISLPKFDEFKYALKATKRDGFLVIIQQLITPFSMAVLTAIAASINHSYVAAFALLFRMEALFLLIPLVLTTSMPAIIGTNYWSGYFDRVKQAYRFVFMFIVITQLVVATFLLLNSEFLAKFLCAQTSVTDHIADYLLFVPWGYLGAGCAMVYQSCLNAKGKTLDATIVAISHRLILLLPLAFLGSLATTNEGFFQGIMLGHLLAGVFVIYAFRSKANQDVSSGHFLKKALSTS